MTSRRLSARADNEMLGIYVSGSRLFGRNQALAYQFDLEHCFDLLNDNPRMGRLASNAGPGIRRHEHGSHVIFYREDEDHILIVAVVHGRSVSDLDL